MKRTPLRRKPNKTSAAARAFAAIKSDSAQKVKDRIQALLRQIVIKRDGGCILRNYPEAGTCGGYAPKAGYLILQAEHLNSRGRSVSYGDLRNIVCLCQRHHGYFKVQQPVLYWSLIRKTIGEERWEYVERVAADNRSYHMTKADWLKVEIGLQQELKQLSHETIT